MEKDVLISIKSIQSIAGEEAEPTDGEKQTAITNAQAEAESIRIRAQAEAEANKTLSESLTKEVIENKKIEKWNGQLPQVQGEADPLITIN